MIYQREQRLSEQRLVDPNRVRFHTPQFESELTGDSVDDVLSRPNAGRFPDLVALAGKR